MKNLCERCHERPGQTNSLYLFNEPHSEPPDLGDWVCEQCEEELEAEAREFANWLYGTQTT